MDPTSLPNMVQALQNQPDQGQMSSLGLPGGTSLGTSPPQGMMTPPPTSSMGDQYSNPFFNQNNPNLFSQNSPYQAVGSQGVSPQNVMAYNL
jgi:hypothetical protein